MHRNWLPNTQQDVVDQLEEGVSAFGCAALLGEFRMGKTPVLRSLLEALQPPRVYVSLAELESERPETLDTHFYRRVLQGLAEDWGGEPPADASLDPPHGELDPWDSYDWFESALERLARRPVTILLDDADRFAGVTWGEQVFHKLPALMRRENNVRIVLAGTGQLEQWAEDLRRRTGRAGLWDLIRTPIVLRAVPLQTVLDSFPDKRPLAHRLIELCGGHPYGLQQLTHDLQVHAQPLKRLLDEMEDKVKQLEPEWDRTFRRYWQTYDHLTRQTCFLLTVSPDGLKRRDLRSRLGPISEDEIERSIAAMTNTGVLAESAERDPVRLIGLFRQWYTDEVGFTEGQTHPIDQRPSPQAPPTPAQEPPTTELTFFPAKDLVFIRRDRFLSYSELDISAGRLSTIRTKTRRVPAADGREFLDNLNLFGDDLWVELHDKPWFQEIIRSVDAEYRLRFNIPIEMGEFPFELLPLDETGTRRIGMQVPISRQLFKQGRYVERAPLALSRAGEERLRVLVVAAEAGGEIRIDADGRVYQGADAQIVDRGESFTLARLRLDQEVEALHQILLDHSDVIGAITFLSSSDRVYPTEERGVNVRCDQPTAECFRAVLQDPEIQFDVLHFVGHGLFVPGNTPGGGLLFGDRLVHLSDLADLLQSQQRLSFVYLSCCESGRLGSDERANDLLGLAHTCVDAGVPAVLAMRWRIPTGASRRLSEAFYPSFFETGALDQALHRAVQQVYNRERDPAKKVYAAAPVLIMH